VRLRFLFGYITGAILTLCVQSAHADADTDLNNWMKLAVPAAEGYLISNISPHDGLLGSVLASPSRTSPDYYYNWIRDAALVMDVYMSDLESSNTTSSDSPFVRHTFVEDLLWNYLSFNAKLQSSNALTGIGEPKFYVTGAPYMGDWGRPQNDGPALRASLLIRFMHYLIQHNRLDEAQTKVWPVILADLTYVGQNALNPSYDLWEEFKGDNFFTLVTDRAALLAGADAALWLKNKSLSDSFKSQVPKIEAVMQGHLNTKTNQVVENMHRVAGLIDKKDSGLDTATVLAVIHTDAYPYLKYDSSMLQNTVDQLAKQFQQIYPINTRSDVGSAFGRYPEDVYYGGNPWFLTTLAVAEYYYKLGLYDVQMNRSNGSKYLALGDMFLQRVRKHVDAQLHMSEQMDRNNGFLLSAPDLSWSYASLLTAVNARSRLSRNLPAVASVATKAGP
jgi:glucoamylase